MKPISMAGRLAIAGVLSLLVAARAGAADAAKAAADVLDTPSLQSPLAQRALVNGLAAAGARMVAVGQRGHILYSDDHGVRWTQAKVPVSSDLTAVTFATAQQGWAVGHDGVVLHSADAGASWTLQLDGRRANQAMLDFYEKEGADPRLLDEAKRNLAQGPDKPFLDVCFIDARHGYVVGAFGLLFETADGGNSWQPLLHRAANPRGLHLNAIRAIDGAVFVAGEQGLVLRKAAGSEQFEALAMPYQGSYFGVLGTAQAVLAYGLRGNAFRSTDGGKSWSKVDTQVPVGLTAGAVMPGQGLVLVSQAGHVLVSADHGATFQPVAGAKPGHAAAVLPDGQGGVVIGGARGVRAQSLK